MSVTKMGIVFSDPQLAIDSGLDYFQKEEENVYVCTVDYPSGVEYHLRKEHDIITEEGVIKKYILTPRHKFRTLLNAMKAVSYFRKRRGLRYCVKRRREVKNGYKFVKYYFLCSM